MVSYSLQISFICTISFNCHNKYFRQVSSFSKDDTETLNLIAYSWEKLDFNPASFYSSLMVFSLSFLSASLLHEQCLSAKDYSKE